MLSIADLKIAVIGLCYMVGILSGFMISLNKDL